MQPVTVSFYYSMVGIPRGGQRERLFFVRGKTNTAIPVAKEAEVAYRVHLPPDNLIDLTRSSRARWTQYPDYDRAASTIEIIRHAGQLWWPVKIDQKKSRYDIGSLSETLEHLASGKGNFLNMLPPEFPEERVLNESPRMRECSQDESEACEGLAQRMVSDNLLIWRDRIFSLGGDPIYVKVSFGLKRYWHIEVINSDPKRDIYRTVIGPLTDLDSHMAWWAQDAMCGGDFWYPQHHGFVRRAAHKLQAHVPSIEILEKDMPVDRTPHLVIDALVRKTIATLVKYNATAPAELLRTSAGRATDELTSSLRHASLSEFFRLHPEALLGMDELRQQFDHFERVISQSSRLHPSDEAALASIGP